MDDKETKEKILSLVSTVKDKLENTPESSKDQVHKNNLEEIVRDVLKEERLAEQSQADKVTAQKEVDADGNPKEIEVQRKSVFAAGPAKKSNKSEMMGIGSLSKYFYVETDEETNHLGARRMLYVPRTDWTSRSGYQLTKSYDGLEDIMELNDLVYFMGAALAHKRRQPYESVVRGLESFRLLNDEIKANGELTRALDTTQNADFIPTQMSARLLDDVRLQLRVAALFPRLALPRSPFENPIRGTRQAAYLVTEATDDSSGKVPTSDPIDKKVTFTAIKFAVRNLFSDEFAEDSIVPVMPWVRSELVQAMADAEEDATINGDSTDTTHLHSDVTAATDRRKAYDGLVYHSAQSSGAAAVDISTLNSTNLRSMRKKMGRFGAQADRLAWVVSISAYIQMLSLTEVITMEKFGPQATIKSGELAKLDGASVIVSEFVRSDLSTTGVYDGTTTTDTIVLLVHTPSFMYGDVGAAKVETDRDIETLQNIIVTHRRTSFQQIHTPGTSEETVGFGYSLTA